MIKYARRMIWRHRVKSWQLVSGEPEEKLLPQLADRRRMALDVGAAMGGYTAPLVPHSKSVIAFEAVPAVAQKLREMFVGSPHVRIENVALSDKTGQMQLRIPRDCFWRSTLETANALLYSGDVATIDIEVRTLDEYKLDNVGFIKIDVEGHEVAVLSGALTTIIRNRPNILVEIEEQHRPGAIQETCKILSELDYRGWYLDQFGRLESIDRFNPKALQNTANLNHKGERRGIYINNFIFARGTPS